jgi:thiol:disulfide interchange protein
MPRLSSRTRCGSRAERRSGFELRSLPLESPSAKGSSPALHASGAVSSRSPSSSPSSTAIAPWVLASTLTIAALFAGRPAEGQPGLSGAPDEKVRWTVGVEPAGGAGPGGVVEVVATYTLEKGWHIYAPDMKGIGVPTRLRVEGPGVTAEGDPSFPKPIEHEIPELGEVQRLLEGSGAIRQKLRLPENAAAGENISLRVQLDYQTCDANTCLPPQKDVPFEVRVAVVATAESVVPVEAAATTGTTPTSETPLLPLPTETRSGLEPGPGIGKSPQIGVGIRGGPSLLGGDDDEPHARWTVRVEPAELRRGAEFSVVAAVECAKGWYVYPAKTDAGFATKIAIESRVLEPRGEIGNPPLTTKTDPEGNPLPVVLNGAFSQRYRVRPNASEGELKVDVVVEYATCNGPICDIPKTERHPVVIRVLPGEPVSADPPVPAVAESGPPSSGSPREAEISATGATTLGPGGTGSSERGEDGLWHFIYLVVLGGIFTLFMPCTYPLIPLTISYFTKQAETRGSSPLILALVYGAGIILSFVLIGVVVGIGAAQGQSVIGLAANPWLNLGIGILLVVMGLSMIGLFSIRLPSGWMSWFTRASATSGSSYVGVLVLGLGLCVLTFTCTAPIMGLILAGAASESEGAFARAILGMAVFGTTIAIPFVLLALFPSKVKSLPKAGDWMSVLKVTLGFVEIFAALKFLSSADLVWKDFREPLANGEPDLWLTRETFLVIWSCLSLTTGLYLLGSIRLASDSGVVGPFRMLCGATFLFFAIYFFRSADGAPLHDIFDPLVPPPPEVSAGSPRESNGTRYPSVPSVTGSPGARELPGPRVLITHAWEEGLELAKNEGLPALVDFTGPTCLTCRLMEGKVFPELPELLAKVVQIRLNTDSNPRQAENLELQARLVRTAARPYYALIDPRQPFEPKGIFGPPPTALTTAALRKTFADWLGPLVE